MIGSKASALTIPQIRNALIAKPSTNGLCLTGTSRQHWPTYRMIGEAVELLAIFTVSRLDHWILRPERPRFAVTLVPKNLHSEAALGRSEAS
jgi:hypothetical protein